MSPTLARLLPRNVYIYRVDDQQPRMVALATTDANQGTGNFAGVVSVGLGASGNLVFATGNTDAAPIIDLNNGIVLSSSAAISFTNTTAPVLTSQSSGAASIGFSFQSQGTSPERDFVVNSTNGGSTSLAEFDVGTSTKLLLDKNGNLTVSGTTPLTFSNATGTTTISSSTTGTTELDAAGSTAPAILLKATSLSGQNAAVQIGGSGTVSLRAMANGNLVLNGDLQLNNGNATGGRILQSATGSLGNNTTCSTSSMAGPGCTGTAAGSTLTFTFSPAYNVTPTCVVSDETTAGGARISTKSASSIIVTTSGATDVVDVVCVGNPR
ncbi:MAG TPA: hypothetical protein VFO25_08265 [Candidatus Eremiobacteraceae bacterium]|nr:hypothetical protein [Candidatus Eremiobacteraceae bacterium]